MVTTVFLQGKSLKMALRAKRRTRLASYCISKWQHTGVGEVGGAYSFIAYPVYAKKIFKRKTRINASSLNASFN